jgi:3-dehydroquinate synthase
MDRLRAVTASRDYDILVGRDCFPELGPALWSRAPGGQVVVCCDDHVAPLYLAAVRESLKGAGYAVSEIVIPAGESQKTLARAEELYGVVYDRGVRRSDTLVALGGGVVGDLLGFVAATYQRGVGFVQVPTTLLAQVDAAIGGKVGVDFRAGKNYVGAFYQPTLVFADLRTLTTLPARELRSGMGEVAKYALADGGDLLVRCERLVGAPLAASSVSRSLVAECIRRKLDVVAGDEREESGGRAVLNLGHTIGHAIEAATGFSRFAHGDAVGLGLRAVLWLSERLCGLPASESARAQALLDGLGLPSRAPGVSPDLVCDLVRRDKKAGKGGVTYVLLAALGTPLVGVAVPADLEREVVAWLTRR